MGRMGRPSKLTPGISAAIVKGVAAGLPLDTAARLADMDDRTVDEWVRRGEGRMYAKPATRAYADFAAAIRKAESQAEAGRIALIMAAARGGQEIWKKTTRFPDGRELVEEKHMAPQWAAAAWLLERRMFEKYGKHERLDVTVIRSEAEKLAEEYGLEKRELDELVAEAEAIAAGRE